MNEHISKIPASFITLINIDLTISLVHTKPHAGAVPIKICQPTCQIRSCAGRMSTELLVDDSSIIIGQMVR